MNPNDQTRKHKTAKGQGSCKLSRVRRGKGRPFNFRAAIHLIEAKELRQENEHALAKRKGSERKGSERKGARKLYY